MPTLLEKALASQSGRSRANSVINEEELQLALAYLDGRVSNKQACVAIKKTHGNVAGWAAGMLVKAYQAGRLAVDGKVKHGHRDCKRN